ncbi:MAG: hypothetical protein WC615_20130 [Mucilaginibacter sp.]|uniref:hypothetical protein n=1 Tax=Mucilaginibacter sp. TaxID=1882438 RepID=UPI003565BE2E
MKKLLLLAAIALLPCLAMAQTETAADAQTTVKAPAEEYCIISTHKGIFERTICIDVDRGQGPEVDKRLRDNSGREMRFNNLADALNYMAQEGWLYINTIKTSNGDDPDYLMRRLVQANKPDELKGR